MKRIYFIFLFLLSALAGCGSAEWPEQRIVLYSTSPGFQPVSPDAPDVSPSPSEVPEPEPPPEDPPAEEPPPEDPSGGEMPPDAGGPPSDGEVPDPPDNPPDDGPSPAPLPAGADPFADRVVSYRLGEGGGLNEGDLPDIVLGAPRGGGLYQGSLHVLSLGVGGEIVLEMTDYLIFDGDGADFTVFENPFQVASDSQVTFAEPGIVGVSEDGENFVDFSCSLTQPYAGCAGVRSVLANAGLNTIDPTDPSVSGGDSFDLEDVGLRSARFIRIRDSGLGLGPIGPGTRGFDLDACVVIHGTLPDE